MSNGIVNENIIAQKEKNQMMTGVEIQWMPVGSEAVAGSKTQTIPQTRVTIKIFVDGISRNRFHFFLVGMIGKS